MSDINSKADRWTVIESARRKGTDNFRDKLNKTVLVYAVQESTNDSKDSVTWSDIKERFKLTDEALLDTVKNLVDDHYVILNVNKSERNFSNVYLKPTPEGKRKALKGINS